MPTADQRRAKQVETFRTEYRKLIGGAIIEGLISPETALPNVAVAAVRSSYGQDNNPGNYTQINGDHDQVNGNYDQSLVLPPRLPHEVIAVDPGAVVGLAPE
jgi:hypothetical protein